MEDKTIKGLLITAIIVSLTALGLPIADKTIGEGISELDGYYICDVIGENSMGEYARLSGTRYTAYPYVESNVGRKYCTNGEVKGTWYTLYEYSEELGIDPYTLLTQEEVIEERTTHDSSASQVRCGQKGCYLV